MKRTMRLIGFCLPLLAGSLVVTAVDKAANKAAITYVKAIVRDWMKSKAGTWPGMKDGKTYWYKLDKKAKLWWSADGKKWAAVADGAWADKDGKWLKINDNKLVWSTDGSTWAEVPEWKWEGSDGKWYKFDSSWMLWVNE